MKLAKSMSNAERLDEILRFIESSKHVSVATICEQYKVSEATARRDLKELQRQGLIKRVHGGALSLRKSPSESPVYQRLNSQAEYKERIGKAAAELVNPGETIFLGSGTSVLEVARNLKHVNELTVITNSILVLNELLNYQNISIICLGGVVRRSELSMIGHLTEDALSGLNADKIFIGIHGIDLVQGLTNHYLPETMTDRKILQFGKQVILVVDHTKCGRISTAHVAPISVIDTLVTDSEAPQDFIDILREQDINVILA